MFTEIIFYVLLILLVLMLLGVIISIVNDFSGGMVERKIQKHFEENPKASDKL